MIEITALEPWQDPRGGSIERVRIDNGNIAIEILSLGGIIRELWTADKLGQRQNIVLGCDSVADYLAQQAYLGAIAGRYSNRIANGQLHYQGQDYQLDINQATNCLHGGRDGFHLKQWHMENLADGVRLTVDSPDGEMGFPGLCKVQLDYRLEGNNLLIDMQAQVDKACPISLTQHSYFNLDGADSETNVDHHIQVDAHQYLTMNDVGVPTSMDETLGSDLDLSKPTPFSEQTQRAALSATNGFDHCYVLAQTNHDLVRFGCLSSPKSGRTMTIYTDQPGVQLYGANFLEGTKGFKGEIYQSHRAVCIEPQMLPDSPNQPHLPGEPWIAAGDTYHHHTRYEFGVL
ncbi:galactose mutarotase [Shewanella sp. MMG014]|uniref:aldose epimerase family protein n=1 Tax=Shewanella sp. MMG014 TaxID=2822691 RepID=UPI001B3596C6|nr:aldose epimerase family protein [Shewanella sp. MMG014]MBQ4890780.1 galactose mutarotase [Shewanella sp. MMG014]